MVEREESSLFRPEKLLECLAYTAESRDLEYKAAVEFIEGTDFASKLVKHIIAFADSGGERIVIGYKEQPDGSYAPDLDLTERIIVSYEHTRLCNYIRKYTDNQDQIILRVHKQDYGGTNYPIICVFSFREHPYVCTKDYESQLKKGELILNKGHVYIRNESAETITAAIVKIHALQEWKQLVLEIKRTQEGSKP